MTLKEEIVKMIRDYEEVNKEFMDDEDLNSLHSLLTRVENSLIKEWNSKQWNKKKNRG